MAGVNIDVTERHLAQALEREKSRIEQASQEKSAFLARMSHELRTPMNAILGFVQLLASDPAEPPSARQAERLGRIGASARHLLGFIDELLEIVRRDQLQQTAADGPATEAPVTPGLPLAAPSMPALRLLCVEDNPVNLILVSELVAMRPQIKLHTAIDGASAIREAAQCKPQVLLLDLQLPDMTGIELMHRLRQDAALAGSRYVALSANAIPDDIRNALGQGFDDYWTKPIDMAAFLAGLDALAQRFTAPAAP
jgi:CheY-like chemotaxis protein